MPASTQVVGVRWPRLLANVWRAGLFALVAGSTATCSAHYASAPEGPTNARDPFVAVFRADREQAWKQFRLGSGLNVVVIHPSLPREFAWRFPTGGISSSPTILGTTILVSANDDHLYAIDAATGSLRWRYRAENEIMSQPAYENGLIYIGIGNADTTAYYPPHFTLVGSGMNKVEAIAIDNGIEQWWAGLDGTGMPSEAIVGNTIVSANGNGTVLANDIHSGAYRWHIEFPTTFAMSSINDGGDGRIYVSGRFENAVYALRSSNGTLIWKHDFGKLDGATSDDPLASTNRALVGVFLEPLAPGPYGMVVTYGARAREHVYALDKRSGRLLWEKALPSVVGTVPPYNEAAIALIYGDHIYVGSAVAPVVTALDMNGRIRWQLHVRGAVKGGMVARDGIIYFGDLGGTLWAISARTGHPLGSIATDMEFNTGSPIIVNDSLILGGREDVIAIPLAAIRESRHVSGVTELTLSERIGRFMAGIIPQRDPHLEAAYFKH